MSPASASEAGKKEPMFTPVNEAQISRAILDAYHASLREAIESEVLIAGAGPSGLMAAWRLAGQGFRVTVVEKRLATGGGIWGGAMGLNQVVVQPEAVRILDELGVRHRPADAGLHVAEAVELAASLTLRAAQAGARILNLLAVEDVVVHQDRVCGLVVNRTMIAGALPVDPLTLLAAEVIDATGHDAAVVECLRRRGLLSPELQKGEGPMDAAAGEKFVVDHVDEVYPGLWVAGMSVCAVFSGPRMGPIFGGMLLSGERAARLVAERAREARPAGPR